MYENVPILVFAGNMYMVPKVPILVFVEKSWYGVQGGYDQFGMYVFFLYESIIILNHYAMIESLSG